MYRIVRLHFLPIVLLPNGLLWCKCANKCILTKWSMLMFWNILRLARTTNRCSLKVLFCDHPSALRQPNWSIVFISTQPTVNEQGEKGVRCVLVISLRCDGQVRHFDCIQWHIMISHTSVCEHWLTHTTIKSCKTCLGNLLLLINLFILTLDSLSLSRKALWDLGGLWLVKR